MANIWSMLQTNLLHTAIGMGIFLLAYIANIAFSIYYNIKVLGQKFNRQQAINSLLKLITFAIGCTCLVTVVTTLPIFANIAGLPLPEEFTNNLTMVAILGFPMYASCKYAIMGFNKMKKVLESGTITLQEFEEDIAEANKIEYEKAEKKAREIVNGFQTLAREETEKVIAEHENTEDEEVVEHKDDVNIDDIMNDIWSKADVTEHEDKVRNNIVFKLEDAQVPEEEIIAVPVEEFKIDPNIIYTEEVSEEPVELVGGNEEIVEPIQENLSQEMPDEVNYEAMEKEQLSC